jgi:hypothetical protein
MGRQIIKQPNGLYAVFSSVVDTFIMWDCTPECIIETWAEEERKRIEQGVRQTCAELDAGGKPYYQFTMDWKEAMATARRAHKQDVDTMKELAEIARDAATPIPSTDA